MEHSEHRAAAAALLRSWDAAGLGIVVNPDIDGLLSALLLHDEFGWPVVGFYDTSEVLLLADWVASPSLPRDKLVWVDLDMCVPGSRSIGQHVNCWYPDDRERVAAYATSINPNDISNTFGRERRVYRAKYPFGTFQYLAWLLRRFEASASASWWSPEAEGLLWMPDGGAWSIAPDRFQQNCRMWAQRHLSGSGLALSANAPAKEIQALVERARRQLERHAEGIMWSPTLQPKLVRTGGRGFDPKLLPIRVAVDLMQGLLDGAKEILGLDRPLRLPTGPFRSLRGRWQTAGLPPAGWPESANQGHLWSMAVTGSAQVSWTVGRQL